MQHNRKVDLILAPIGEAVLLLIVGAVGVALHRPMIFNSLGPTAYEMLEKPYSKSARVYNILAGHFLAVLSGFAAVAMLNAWSVPAVGEPIRRARLAHSSEPATSEKN